MPNGSVDWAAHDATLRDMAAAGVTGAKIAAKIPGATRSAVLGRARRLGVTLGVPEVASAKPRVASAVDWAAHEAELRDMVAKGMSAAEIAAKIAGATAASVISKASRLGVPLKKPKIVAALVPPKPTAERRRPFQPKAPEVAIAVRHEAPFQAPAGARAMLLLKMIGECRWPFDCDDGVARLACGAPTDKTYCAAHAALAYAASAKSTPPKPKPIVREVSRLAAAVEVPPWVPAQLAGRYRAIALRDGEEEAASQVRQLKRVQAAA